MCITNPIHNTNCESMCKSKYNSICSSKITNYFCKTLSVIFFILFLVFLFGNFYYGETQDFIILCVLIFGSIICMCVSVYIKDRDTYNETNDNYQSIV